MPISDGLAVIYVWIYVREPLGSTYSSIPNLFTIFDMVDGTTVRWPKWHK